MDAKRLDERLGPDRLDDPDTAEVEAIFRDKTQFTRIVGQVYEASDTHLWTLFGLITAALFVVWLAGFAIGGGFSASEADPSAEAFVAEQTELIRQQSIELQETRSRLAVAEGQTAFLRSQVTGLTEDAERLQGSLNEARLEMSIIIGIYEECLNRLYAAECIAAARPAAEAFIDEFFAETP